MIRIENLSKSFPTGILFENVNIHIKKKMRCGLVGANGTGKSTLLKLMLGLDNCDSGIIQKRKNLKIGYLAQDVVEASKFSIIDYALYLIPNYKKYENLMFYLSNKISLHPNNKALINEFGALQNKFDSIGGYKLRDDTEKILSGLGFMKNQIDSTMSSLSGGWRMRVALAGILVQQPDILFLDEPTNHLDLEATIWLEKFLSLWKGSIVLISHDREFLNRSVNHIMDIDFNKVTIYRGNYSDFEKEKLIRTQQEKLKYENQQKLIKNSEVFIDRFRYKSTKSKQVQSRIKSLQKLEKVGPPKNNMKNINLLIPEPNRPPLKLINFINIEKKYGENIVFKNLNFLLERGSKIGLVGPNGAGKSTFLKLLAGVEDVTSGSVKINSNITRAYYAQHQLDILEEKDSVFDIIDKASSGLAETKIRSYLGGFLFTKDEIKKEVRMLSGGEKARLALAKILVDPVHLLLLDEPSNHLDMMSRNVIEQALIRFRGSIVCISHDRHLLNTVSSSICEVSDTRIKIYNGNYKYYELKKNQELSRVTVVENIKDSKKENYKELKLKRNRKKWIEKRYDLIEKEILDKNTILIDKKNVSNYNLVQYIQNEIKLLENEYFKLMEEKEELDSLI